MTRHFLASCSDDAKGHETVVRVDVNGETFSCRGLQILALNFLDVFPYQRWTGNVIPRMEQGQEFEPEALMLEDGSTQPPALLTEAELIALMDVNGIGTGSYAALPCYARLLLLTTLHLHHLHRSSPLTSTDATIASHIRKIQDREYAVLNANRRFEPCPIGLALVAAYEGIGLDCAYAALLSCPYAASDISISPSPFLFCCTPPIPLQR